jgi:hypothetical protein
MFRSGAVWIALAANLVLAQPTLPAQTDQGRKDWGASVEGLQISLYLTSQKTDSLGIPTVGLAIKNSGAWRRVALGGFCGQEPPGSDTADVRLTLTNEQGGSQELEDIPGPPLVAGCAGAMAIVSVDVLPGATTSVPIDLDCYYAQKGLFDYAWAGGGEYSLRAELEIRSSDQSQAAMLRSNELRLQFPKDAAPRRCFSSGLEIPCHDK